MKLVLDYDLDKFDDYVKNHPFGSILQTSAWAKVKASDWQPHFLTFLEDDKIVATALLLQRNTAKLTSLFYCSRGFVLDYNKEIVLKEVIALTKEYVKSKHGFLLRFDPEIPLKVTDTKDDQLITDNQKYYDMISKHAKSTGLSLDMSSTFQPRFQMVVNLKDNVDVLSLVKSKKRRLVKDTYLQPRGFEIIEDTSVNGVKEFSRLSKLTEIRQNVALRNKDYFMNMYEAFKDKNDIKIFFAKLDIDVLIEYTKTLENSNDEVFRLVQLKNEHGQYIYTNGIICIYGTPMVQMFYGASDEAFAKYKPGYGLHFHGIKDAQDNGYDYFNLGGVQGTLDDGLSRFKSEFGPELFEYVGDFDVIINQPFYNAFTKGLPLLKTIKRKIKR